MKKQSKLFNFFPNTVSKTSATDQSDVPDPKPMDMASVGHDDKSDQCQTGKLVSNHVSEK